VIHQAERLYTIEQMTHRGSGDFAPLSLGNSRVRCTFPQSGGTRKSRFGNERHMSPDLNTHCLFTTCKTRFLESTATGEGRNGGHGGETEKERKGQRARFRKQVRVYTATFQSVRNNQCGPSLTAEPSHTGQSGDNFHCSMLNGCTNPTQKHPVTNLDNIIQ